jgi:lipopolysaccharide transport system ATP-binding protein
LIVQYFKRGGEALEPQPETAAGVGGRGREEFWALRDVSFTVEQGETVGIIGPNGAGKSTALKLISRIIEPTSGEIEVNGRIGALLELGTGFHPDLSGRENIYLNGSILGLSRAEIDRKLDSIIGFAELERFIDMPVKHYSSGMRMRLGFAVAAHVDPELLLVDEVLAVGDQNFQNKCLDRIMEMRHQGVTICFVSHGLGAVRRLCSRAIWLNNGAIWGEGRVDDVVSAYLRYAADEEESRLRTQLAPVGGDTESREARIGRPVDLLEQGEGSEAERAEIVEVSFLDPSGAPQHIFRTGQPWAARVRYRCQRPIEDLGFRLSIHRNDGLHVCGSTVHSADLGISSVEGEGSILYRVERLALMEGTYWLSVSPEGQADTAKLDGHDRRYTFRVRQVGSAERYGLISLDGRWEWKAGEAKPLVEPSSECVRSERRTGAGLGSKQRWGVGDIQIVSVSFLDRDGRERRVFETDEPWTVRLCYRARQRITGPVLGLAVHREDGVHVCGPNTHFGGLDIPFVEGEGEVLYRVDHLPLVEGTYVLSVSAHNQMDTLMYDYHDRLYAFKVCQFGGSREKGIVRLRGEWRWQDAGPG